MVSSVVYVCVAVAQVSGAPKNCTQFRYWFLVLAVCSMTFLEFWYSAVRMFVRIS
jgi:hypothetical protein